MKDLIDVLLIAFILISAVVSIGFLFGVGFSIATKVLL